MIKSFCNKSLENLFVEGKAQKINPKHRRKLMILDWLHDAAEPEDMNFPGSKFHPLKGKLQGFYSVKVSGNWRVIFRFRDGDAYDVDYVDYH